MEKYKGLHKLLSNIATQKSGEWIYTDPDQALRDPIHAEYYLIPFDEVWNMDEEMIYDDEFGNVLPTKYKDKNLRKWLKVNDIQVVVVDAMCKYAKLTETLIANELVHHFQSIQQPEIGSRWTSPF